MEQIETEGRPARQFRQRSVAGGQDPDVDGSDVVGPDGLHFAVLHDSQQCRLQCTRGLADFVQQQGGAVSGAQTPETRPGSPGKRTAVVTEELGHEDLRAETCAVDHVQRPVTARAGRVDGACDDLLAGPALAHDQNGLRIGGPPGYPRPNRADVWAITDEPRLDLPGHERPTRVKARRAQR